MDLHFSTARPQQDVGRFFLKSCWKTDTSAGLTHIDRSILAAVVLYLMLVKSTLPGQNVREPGKRKELPVVALPPELDRVLVTMSAIGTRKMQCLSPLYVRRMGSRCKTIDRRYVVARPSSQPERAKEAIHCGYARSRLPRAT